jgi:hypothetical protein
MTLEYLTSKYGLRMTIKDLETEIRIPAATLMNKRSSGTLPFATHRDGMRVFAFTNDVATYLDSKRVAA